MATTVVNYAGDGSTTQFTYSFDSLADTYVVTKVTNETSVDVTGNYTVSLDYDTSTVTITPAPAVGYTVEIKRATSTADDLFSFPAGTVMKPSDLEMALKTVRDYAEESADQISLQVDTISSDAVDDATSTALAYRDQAGTHATNAGTSETNAASSASAAATSATNAGTSETNAASSASAASTSATNAQNALNQFNDRYLGSHTNVASDDAEVEAYITGDANITKDAGDIYFDSTNSVLKYYTVASGWLPAAATTVIDTSNLGNVGNVTITSATTGDIIEWNGSQWVNVPNFSGSYNDLTNKPTIPANAGDLGDVTITAAATGEVLKYNGSAWVDANVDYSELTGVPSTFTPAAHTHAISDVTNLQTSLDAKADSADVGANNGIAPLDANGLVPSGNLPSYVDDIIEAADLTALNALATKETGKIYLALDTGDIYRWSGSAFVQVGDAASSADQATKLATARTISLSGDVTGSVSFDGTANVDIVATVVDDSHSHIIGDVDGLQTALDAKQDASSAFDGAYTSLTSVPTEFTPAAHTHAISEVTNLQTELDAKATTGKAIAMAIVFG